MRTFAEIDADRRVLRVVVCNDPDWLASELGGEWVETLTDDETVSYCGAGYGYDPDDDERFAPEWKQPLTPDDAYAPGAVVWHEGALWRNAWDGLNFWQPGYAGWHRHGLDPSEVQPWVQPAGTVGAYSLGDRALHNGAIWESTWNGPNTWEPGFFGWQEVT